MTEFTILVIDDNIEFPHLLRLLLKGEGFEIEVAHNGDEGIRNFQRISPHLVIVDALMPQGISGWDVTQRIRDLPNDNATVPIIMLSGYTDEESRQQASKVGVDLYLTKPILRDTLVQAISNLLSR